MEKLMRSLGIDLSLTGTGLVLLEHRTRVIARKVFGTDAEQDLMARCSEVASEVLQWIEVGKPDVICVEDYAITPNGGNVIKLVSLGAVIRYFFRQKGISYYTVPPNTLKMFATGKGNAGKEQVMMHVYKKWTFEAVDNNEADAYVLAKMGCCVADPELATIDYEKKAMKSVVKVDCNPSS